MRCQEGFDLSARGLVGPGLATQELRTLVWWQLQRAIEQPRTRSQSAGVFM